jgi:hypothetical protein
MNELPRRNHPFWIEQYVSYTNYLNSPAIYRKWAAFSGISAVLQRKTFCVLNGTMMYPNLFVALVGPPGLGKTQAIMPIRKMLASLESVKLSQARLSAEKLINSMTKAFTLAPLQDDPFFTQTAFAVFVSELSTFIRPNDIEFMTQLADLYDCPEVWGYGTISRGDEKLENVFLSIIGGITPKSLATNFGAAAFGQGFTSRLNMIYSEDYKIPDLFGTRSVPSVDSFQKDLQQIAKLHGAFTFTKEAEREFQSWLNSGMLPAPADGRLQEYLPRRWMHLAKLCMIYSAAERNDLIIEISQYEKAKAALLEAEAVLPKALEFMGTSPVMEALRNVHSWMLSEYNTKKLPISETKIKQKLLFDVQPQNLNSTIIELVASGYAKVLGTGPDRKYIPLVKEA